MNPLLLTDGYKTSHHKMYPKGTTLVYSNFTPRNVNYMPEGAKKIVVFGVQYTIKYIKEQYDKYFFSQPKDYSCIEAKNYLSDYLGCDYDVSHFEALHDLGYLPIEIKALDEGTVLDAKIPILTIKNTHPDFFWLPNFLETLISSLLWKPLHSASLAKGYKDILVKYASETDKENLGFVGFQGHDFSFRGMQHPESAISSSLGFLTSFKGTDTIPALLAAKKYYNSSNVGFSVPASEHAVMTSYGKEDEIGAFKRLIEQYPTGILSVVSDSFDLWKVLTEFLPKLKEQILSRDGKLVIRPDSGDPVDIICGNYIYDNIEHWDRMDKTYNRINYQPSDKGVIELLWDTFGGTINAQGYKVLDSHIGAIYGDSITLERAEQICSRLKAKGFASTNIVLGIGSYSMGYATRDNQGGAVKATYVEVNGEGREIFKDPVTDDGTKKSKKGLLYVQKNDVSGELECFDKVNWQIESTGELKTVFKDGYLTKETTLDEIRNKLNC
jgi:nicotinamide phosphoribosyltransferase